jgi:[ribosomal protein S5]-alanine N-acetyltransferase
VIGPRLSDGEILLRPYSEADIGEVVRLTNDPDILRYTTIPDPNTAGGVREFIASHADDDETHMLIVDPGDEGLVLGAVGIGRIAAEHARGEIGWWVGAQHRGRGLGARAARLLGDWALSAERGLHRIEAQVDVRNGASRRTAERAGLAFEGVLRSYMALKGEVRDVAMYARVVSS